MRPALATLPAGIIVAVLAGGALGQQTAPQPERGHELALNGNPDGTPPCSQCHGLDGAGDPDAPYPRLAGQPAFYLYKQLNDYATGARQNEIMQPIAAALSDQERQDSAAYYASLDSPYKAAPATAPEILELGRTLAGVGSATARVQACGNCHGPEGEGQPPTFPQLAGQYAPYAQAQLDAFRQGHRRNDVAAVMREIAGSLSEQEIAAVSAYLESVRP
jgi:cytochrome c553